MVQGEMDDKGSQLPKSQGSQTLSSSKVLLLHYWEQKSSRFSSHTPYLDLAPENFVKPLVDLKDSEPSLLRPGDTTEQEACFQGRPPPHLFRGASPNLSRTKSLDSLESKVSIPLPEKGEGGVAPPFFFFLSLPVKLNGSTVPSLPLFPL